MFINNRNRLRRPVLRKTKRAGRPRVCGLQQRTFRQRDRDTRNVGNDIRKSCKKKKGEKIMFKKKLARDRFIICY